MRLKCLCCDELSEGELLCEDCRGALEDLRIEQTSEPQTVYHGVFRYEGVAKKLIVMLKMECLAAAADVLAEEMAPVVRTMNLPEDTVMTWVTMPDARKRQRGIDHGQTLCEALANRVDLPAWQLMVRVGKARTQRGLHRAERMKNLAGSFQCPEPVTSPVLLIDDVMTTGATAEACCQALLRAGAPRIYVLTAAQVMKKSKQADQKG